jgi:L-threonylcarbamoyladenylate synthase
MTPSALKLQRAVAALKSGGVIAYPTEAVWGFGCDPLNPFAVDQLLELKKRPVNKGLILIAASVEQFAPYLEGLAPALRDKFYATAGDHVSWLTPVNGYAPSWVTGQHSSIALRVSTHSLARDLCCAFGGPIVSTSANISGQPTPRQPWPLRKFLSRGLDYILPGELGGAPGPSAIRDLLTDQVIRVT